MSIQNIQGASEGGPAVQPKAGGQINRDDFLKLLIAQLQNQDPLSPMDNQEFAVQLATFNSLEQLIGLNEKLETLAHQQGLSDQFNGAALIGKEVTGSGNGISLSESGDTNIYYELVGNAAKVNINIIDSSGSVLRRLEVSNQKAGPQTLSWSGETTLGQRLPAGTYFSEIRASDAAGNPLPVKQQVRGVVSGVNLEGREAFLEIGQLRMPLNMVTAIR